MLLVARGFPYENDVEGHELEAPGFGEDLQFPIYIESQNLRGLRCVGQNAIILHPAGYFNAVGGSPLGVATRQVDQVGDSHALGVGKVISLINRPLDGYGFLGFELRYRFDDQFVAPPQGNIGNFTAHEFT